ncbi:MAG: flagellar biosynthesis anti-sigma factor FlgM [Gammaproteobacteria bacterium]|nr:flagellar biosynthesis anti-sigma factor FlgM [Gammaproteobacteria bacterium]MBL6998427.1 flagellar biosynthesis anti-sigma factor FlgM [Gammaproteobacteria bacterium]
MTDAINSNNRIKAPTQPPDQRTKSSTGGSQPAAKSAPSGAASAVVELYSNKILAQIEKLPEVDESRIQSIKNALANGDYKPDPEVIARKFAEIEKLLP